MTRFHNRIHALAASVGKHSALDSAFYRLWMSRLLSADQVELSAWNFYARVNGTPNRIALIFLPMTDVRARAGTVENLADGMGMGDPGRTRRAAAPIL